MESYCEAIVPNSLSSYMIQRAYLIKFQEQIISSTLLLLKNESKIGY